MAAITHAYAFQEKTLAAPGHIVLRAEEMQTQVTIADVVLTGYAFGGGMGSTPFVFMELHGPSLSSYGTTNDSGVIDTTHRVRIPLFPAGGSNTDSMRMHLTPRLAGGFTELMCTFVTRAGGAWVEWKDYTTAVLRFEIHTVPRESHTSHVTYIPRQ